MTSRFLNSSVQTNDVASESTLRNISDQLAGTLDVTYTPPANQNTTLTDVNIGAQTTTLGTTVSNLANPHPVDVTFPVSQTVDGSVSVSNLSNPHPISGSVSVSSLPAVTGSVSVSNFPANQPVSGTVAVSSLPAVTGTVSVSNFPVTQPVSGSVAVTNFPSPQSVSGTVNVGNFPGNQAVSITANSTDFSKEATQIQVRNAVLTIDSKLPTLGQKAAAGSQAGVLSADYASTCYVATDVGQSVTAALDQSLVTGNIPVNKAQIAGNAVATNSGTLSAGTQRVAIATDDVNMSAIEYSLRPKSESRRTRYYMKGFEEPLGTVARTIGASALFGNTINPGANQLIQVTSDSIADVNKQIKVYGFQEDGTPVEDVITLDGVDSRLPVTSTNQYFRINYMRVVSNTGQNAGNIYATPNGAPLSSGAPASGAFYLSHITTQNMITYIAKMHVPQSATAMMYPKSVSFQVYNDTTSKVTIQFKSKQGGSSIYALEWEFSQYSSSSGTISWDLSGIPPIFLGNKGADLQISAVKSSVGGEARVSVALAVETVDLS